MTFVLLTFLFLFCLLTYLTKKNADIKTDRKIENKYGKGTKIKTKGKEGL